MPLASSIVPESMFMVLAVIGAFEAEMNGRIRPFPSELLGNFQRLVLDSANSPHTRLRKRYNSTPSTSLGVSVTAVLYSFGISTLVLFCVDLDNCGSYDDVQQQRDAVADTLPVAFTHTASSTRPFLHV